MSRWVGLDWAASGWLGIGLEEDGGYDFDLYPSLLSAWQNHPDAERLLVDIPVGLRQDGKRACDERAADLLKPHRHNSVFTTPVREAVYAKTLTEAKEYNEPFGFSISNQAWSICPRIREGDEFLDAHPEAIGTLREAHPEVCFATLNGGDPLADGKQTEAGLQTRTELLFERKPTLERVYEDVVGTFIEQPAWARRLSGNSRDDVVDALVLAYTAALPEAQLTTVPAAPGIDKTKAEPLPIEIVKPN